MSGLGVQTSYSVQHEESQSLALLTNHSSPLWFADRTSLHFKLKISENHLDKCDFVVRVFKATNALPLSQDKQIHWEQTNSQVFGDLMLDGAHPANFKLIIDHSTFSNTDIAGVIISNHNNWSVSAGHFERTLKGLCPVMSLKVLSSVPPKQYLKPGDALLTNHVRLISAFDRLCHSDCGPIDRFELVPCQTIRCFDRSGAGSWTACSVPRFRVPSTKTHTNATIRFFDQS